MGGLGVTQTIPIAAAAYISSRVQTYAGMVADLLEMYPGIPTDAQELITAHNVTPTSISRAYVPPRPHERHLTENGLMDRATLREAALLRAFPCPKKRMSGEVRRSIS